jgi:hypothetical protein
MPRYRALARGQSADGTWRQPGEVFETDAPVGKWMEPLDEPKSVKTAKAAKPAVDDE